MRIAIFGGSFNPPHKGHLNSALYAAKQLQPDRFLVIPDFQPPHKDMGADSPTPQQRMDLCRLNFAAVPQVECSPLELHRGGKSYTADTLRQLRDKYPEAELYLLVGTDMLESLSRWYEADYILKNVVVAPFQRSEAEQIRIDKAKAALERDFGARVEVIASEPLAASSTEIRQALTQRGGRVLLTDSVYGYIIRNRLYGARVDFAWLREKSYAMLRPKRIPHVQGCETEAISLAKRWGCDPEQAAEAAILHDCTKKERLAEQLALCAKYGVQPDPLEQSNEKLLHAKTGAAVAEYEFGAEPAVVEAIRWHTTGRADMRLLEKIMYMADYIEPNRAFEGVERLRTLAYSDLDAAMRLGLKMSLDDIRAQGNIPHPNSLEALEFYSKKERVAER